MLTRIEPQFHEKVWGTERIDPWFAPRSGKTGEVWYQTDPPLPLLTKFIFTSERLSVQVHPNDEQAQARGLANGKTEMWHILRADPGATIALGFRRPVTLEQARQAALDGSILDLLHWEPAVAGQTYFTRANTVHALGGGLAVCEIQQNSDTTYRLYDYGRGRELHLEDGLAVSELGVWKPEPPDCEYFVSRVDEFSQPASIQANGKDFELLVILDGAGSVDSRDYRAGECWLLRGSDSVSLQPSQFTRILRAGRPAPLVS